jgi:hypothetical protein
MLLGLFKQHRSLRKARGAAWLLGQVGMHAPAASPAAPLLLLVLAAPPRGLPAACCATRPPLFMLEAPPPPTPPALPPQLQALLGLLLLVVYVKLLIPYTWCRKLAVDFKRGFSQGYRKKEAAAGLAAARALASGSPQRGAKRRAHR